MYQGNPLNASAAVLGIGSVAALPDTGVPAFWSLVAIAVGLNTIGYLLLASRNFLPARRRRTV
ncbi:hypothetical protein G1H11_12140 [Phytoactinopolyspora alkaliphila]|uniref:Uncharacterized protein n=1 Tax=Phytoactinopolyspora alkaliphila TaxID=1783498 RepID=A0A6N9YMH5_9ACTN|nr:hypothetical protein [Phytoactinopolyspora alkaliphila]NED96058.1 hypothetical protein [Phytoactinopolyspora alkaliphila]